jgi:hypothetical protein
LVELTDHSKSQTIQIIIGCDANAHHKVWVSGDTNEKGGSLKIRNTYRGKVVTYSHEELDREEVNDLILTSTFLKSKVKYWHLSREPSLFDQRRICFKVEISRSIKVPTRISKRT